MECLSRSIAGFVPAGKRGEVSIKCCCRVRKAQPGPSSRGGFAGHVVLLQVTGSGLHPHHAVSGLRAELYSPTAPWRQDSPQAWVMGTRQRLVSCCYNVCGEKLPVGVWVLC